MMRKTSYDVEAICEDYKAGMTAPKIATKHDISNTSVYSILKRAGVKKDRNVGFEGSKDKIQELYEMGMSCNAISKELGIPESSCNRYMKKMGLDLSKFNKNREDPIVNHKDQIIKMYEEGMGSYTIAKKFDCDESSVTRLLNKLGVEKRPLRQIGFDERFFENIDTEVKAYFLGLMYSDGNVQDRYARIALTDEQLVLDFANAVNYTGEVKTIEPRQKHHKTQYNLSLCSTQMCKDLDAVGCHKNKTFTLRFPSFDIVPRHLMSHLVRGYLDGDGSISIVNHHKDLMVGFVQFVGNRWFMSSLSEFLKDEIDCGGSQFVANKNYNHDIHKLTIGGRIQSLRFLDWLYKDATVFLKRKHDIYLELKKLERASANND